MSELDGFNLSFKISRFIEGKEIIPEKYREKIEEIHEIRKSFNKFSENYIKNVLKYFESIENRLISIKIKNMLANLEDIEKNL